MSDTAQDPHVGSQFGHYVLRRLLGRGGMGEVYEAEDTLNDRVVALKLLPEALSRDETYRERLEKEAGNARKVQDPHVVPINDFGEIDGRLYIDMQLIDGTDLGTILQRQGSLSPVRAAAIVRQIASALDAAHNGGVMHRDVKTQNILITSEDFAYLVDFGVAQATGEERVTAVGAPVGTYMYMAPERFSGSDVDFRADIYSLTCVLYECLTGSPPYRADDISAVIAAHLMRPPPRPSADRPGIPRAWDEVVACGMAKRPEDRYGSAGALALAAEQAAESNEGDQPASDTPVEPSYPPPEHRSVPTNPGVTYPTPMYYYPGYSAPLVMHDDVRFSVYRPTSVRIGHWTPLLASIHLGGHPGAENYLLHAVRRRASGVLGDRLPYYVELSVDSPVGLSDEAELVLVLDLPGFEVQPQSRTFLWLNTFCMEEFNIKAGPDLAGVTTRGKLLTYQGHEQIGEMVLAIRVHADGGWGATVP